MNILLKSSHARKEPLPQLTEKGENAPDSSDQTKGQVGCSWHTSLFFEDEWEKMKLNETGRHETEPKRL